VRQRFGNSVQARRVYNLSFPGQYVLRRPSQRGDSVVQSPALIISPLE
jgi:hypothetical protein